LTVCQRRLSPPGGRTRSMTYTMNSFISPFLGRSCQHWRWRDTTLACLYPPPKEPPIISFPPGSARAHHPRLQNAFDVSCFTINSCRRPSETKTQSATLADAPLIICLQPRQRSPRKAPDAEDVFFFFPVFGSQACAASFS